MKIISKESADLIANSERRIKEELKVLSVKVAQSEAKLLARKIAKVLSVMILILTIGCAKPIQREHVTYHKVSYYEIPVKETQIEKSIKTIFNIDVTINSTVWGVLKFLKYVK